LKIAAERDSSNGVTSDKLPSVIPRDLAKIPPREFNEVVLQQSQRLGLTGSRGTSSRAEEQFRDFKCAAREEFYTQHLEKQSDLVKLREGWEHLGNASLPCFSSVLASPPSFRDLEGRVRL
jgi:hypothetical protein